MRISEIIFGLTILLGIYFNKKNFDGGDSLIALSAGLLAINYIIFGFLILNKITIRNVFKTDSYQSLSKLDIAISIIGGLILGIQVFGITFLMLKLEGASFMFNVGVILGVTIILSVAIRYLFMKNVEYKPMFVRTGILIILLLIFNNYSIYPQKSPVLKDDHILVRLIKEQKAWPDPDSIMSKVIIAQQKRVGDSDYKEGAYISFYDTGDTASVVHYVRDTLDGSYKLFGNENRIFQTGNYKMGQPVGVHKQYYDNGVLKKYIYHDPPTGLVMYSKRFDQNGKQIDGTIAVKMPNRITQDTLKAGEKLRLGFSLEHSMFATPRMYMYLINKTLSGYDTIGIDSDTSFLEYDIEILEGINKYQVDLFELDGNSDTIRGKYSEEFIYYGQ